MIPVIQVKCSATVQVTVAVAAAVQQATLGLLSLTTTATGVRVFGCLFAQSLITSDRKDTHVSAIHPATG